MTSEIAIKTLRSKLCPKMGCKKCDEMRNAINYLERKINQLTEEVEAYEETDYTPEEINTLHNNHRDACSKLVAFEDIGRTAEELDEVISAIECWVSKWHYGES